MRLTKSQSVIRTLCLIKKDRNTYKMNEGISNHYPRFKSPQISSNKSHLLDHLILNSNNEPNNRDNNEVILPFIQSRSNGPSKAVLPLPSTKEKKRVLINKCNNDKNLQKDKKANEINNNIFRSGKKTKTYQMGQNQEQTGNILKLLPSGEGEIYPNSQASNHPIRTKHQFNDELNTLTLSKQINESVNEEEAFQQEDNLAPKRKIVRKSMGMSQAGIKNETEKENQDSFFILNNVVGIEDYHIYGVMDGHGANGHLVSAYIKQATQRYFNKEEAYCFQTKKRQPLNAATVLHKLMMHDYVIIKNFFHTLSAELIDEKFDVHFSGSTCVVVFKLNNKLICANVGDSRAIIVKESPNDHCKNGSDPFAFFESDYLSKDHKPENLQEKERIEKMGGIVEQNTHKDGEKRGPYRVWVKGEKHPGLAMSRSIGDEIAESIGVVHDPDIIIKDITDATKYIVLASDGVWEFLGNDQVMNIINTFFFKNDIKGACEAVISEAAALWKKEDIGRDDITILISFLGHIHIKKCTV